MSQIYTFNEPGSIPGIPGTFAHCQVEVLDSGGLLISPLEQYPAFTPSITVTDGALSPEQITVVAALPDEPVAQPISVPLVQNGG